MNQDILLAVMPSDYDKKIEVLRAIDRPLDEMSIQEICQKANISKSSFYRMFGTKWLILSWYMGSCVHPNSVLKMGRTLSCDEAYAAYFRLILRERDSQTASRCHARTKELYAQGFQKRYKHILDLANEKGFEPNQKLQIESSILINAEFDLTDKILLETKPDLTLYVECMVESIPKTLRELFDSKST